MDKPCQFCGSPTRLVEGDWYPYPDATEKVKTPCCNAQKANMNYIRKRHDPSKGNVPDLEEVEKW